MKKEVKQLVRTLYKGETIDIRSFKQYCNDLSKEEGCIGYNVDKINNEMCKYVSICDGKIKFHKNKQNDYPTFEVINKLNNNLAKKNENVFAKKNENVFAKKNENVFAKKNENNSDNTGTGDCDDGDCGDGDCGDGTCDDCTDDENTIIFDTIKKEMKENELYGLYDTNWCNDIQTDDIITDDILIKTNKYNYLASLPFPPQKSLEWHNSRRERITASDGGCVLGENPYEDQYLFVIKKVSEPEFQYNENCYHGNKYEEIATNIYEYRMNVKVREFGLIKHPNIYYLAASPDGIITPYKLDEIHLTQYVGRMLEIKCPKSRKLVKKGNETGLCTDKNVQCPKYYWIQVQLQLECCDLDECDFWQCDIFEYSDRDDFINDSDPYRQFISKTTNKEKSCLIQLLPKKFDNNDNNMDYNNKVYKYSKFIYPEKKEMTPYELDIWIDKTQKTLSTTHPDYLIDRIIYWRLNDSHYTLIKRNKNWFNDNLPQLEKVWKYVEYFRQNTLHFKLLIKYINSLQILKWYENDKRKKRNEEIMQYYDIISGNDKKAKKILLAKLEKS
jgi:hypothetical protein